MSKVLVLTCSTGEGHNSAALAVQAALQKRGEICDLIDPVSFKSEKMQHTVASLYNNMIKKVPSAFGVVYKLGDLYCSTNLPSPVYWANSRYADALKEYILENGYDVVVATHLYGMEALTAIRKDPDFKVHCYGVLTDYVTAPFTQETDLDGFFVPSEEVKQHLIKKGIAEDIITVSGIPVHQSFTDRLEKEEARKRLEIPEDKDVFLIMTGGIGCENMVGLCSLMLERAKENDLIYIMTGKNEKLKKRLDEEYKDNGHLRTVAFTKEVALYMAAADVLLTKPGGLSTTEAATLNIPLVHVHAIPGCETYNARFFESHGMSVQAHTNNEAVIAANDLIENKENAEQMCAMQRKYINAHAADLIAQRVLGK